MKNFLRGQKDIINISMHFSIVLAAVACLGYIFFNVRHVFAGYDVVYFFDVFYLLSMVFYSMRIGINKKEIPKEAVRIHELMLSSKFNRMQISLFMIVISIILLNWFYPLNLTFSMITGMIVLLCIPISDGITSKYQVRAMKKIKDIIEENEEAISKFQLLYESLKIGSTVHTVKEEELASVNNLKDEIFRKYYQILLGSKYEDLWADFTAQMKLYVLSDTGDNLFVKTEGKTVEPGTSSLWYLLSITGITGGEVNNYDDSILAVLHKSLRPNYLIKEDLKKLSSYL